jgi:hypothetical protein
MKQDSRSPEQNRSLYPHQPPPRPLNPTPYMESRVCIHKATLHKKIDFKFDYFLRLFTDIYLGTQWCLHDSFKIQLFYYALG